MTRNQMNFINTYTARYVRKVYLSHPENRYASALAGYLRGQWVNINGMTGRIVNHIGDRVVIMLSDGMFAVYH